jgi:hypothetical protein
MSNSSRSRRDSSKIRLSLDPTPVAASGEGRIALQQIVRLLACQAAKEVGVLPVSEMPE